MAGTSDSTSSTEVSKVVRPGLIRIGCVVGGHSVHGQVRLRILADAAALRDVDRLTLAGERPDAPDSVFRIESLAAGRRGELRLTLAGVTTRDGAEALRGRDAFVPAEALAPLDEGEVYGHELLGCRLEDEHGALVGHVRDIWQTGAPDVLVVEAADGREHLIPAALLRELDVAAGHAVVEILPGLLDPEEAV